MAIIIIIFRSMRDFINYEGNESMDTSNDSMVVSEGIHLMHDDL